MTEASLKDIGAEEIFHPGSSFLAEVGRIELRTRRSIDSAMSGAYKTAFKGNGLVFSDLREYQPGDDVKHIQWNASARTGKIYVKSYEEERELQIILAIDMSSSTNFGHTKVNFQKAIEFAAVVTVLAQRAQDSVGLCLFSDEVHEYIPPAKSRFNFHRIVKALASDRQFQRGTDVNAPMRQILEKQKKRSVVFLLSDFYSRSFREDLKSFALKHDVIFVVLTDIMERELPDVGIVEYEDSESGKRVCLDTSQKHAAKDFQALCTKRIKRIRQIAHASGVDSIVIEDNPIRPLADLMRARVARLR